LFGLALSLLALAPTSASAAAPKPPVFSHGAVFTETNTAPNYVLAYSRSAQGALRLVGRFATGGNGQTANNPPAKFPTLDSAGAVVLGRFGTCLFAVNAGSSTVSAFRLTTTGLTLVNHLGSGGHRPISLTTTIHGSAGRVLLYVLNSDTNHASIHGYTVGSTCAISHILHSTRRTTSQHSVPAQILFDTRGKVLAVSQRFANDIDIFPVNRFGRTGRPVVTIAGSGQKTPYGMAWNNRDLLAVSNENFPPPHIANSTVTTYTLKRNGKLVERTTAASPGAACWNVFTNNGRYLFVTNPAGPLFGGHNVVSFRVGLNGSLTPVAGQNTTYNSLDDALTRDNRFLYVLSDMLLPVPGPHSAINSFRVNPRTGAFTPLGVNQIVGNRTAGLAAL
jgi:6-phosphogluconolactonase (cycloisomerase 2 family)